MVDKDRVLEGLAPHQKEALDRLANGRILCGDVGSGKSRVGGAYWLLRKSNAPLVIITTAKKRDTGEWEQDLKALGCYEGYEVDSWNNIKKYSNRSRCLFIFDEQRLVGSGAWVKAFYRIARHNSWIMLSATPGDTWQDYIPVMVANGYYANKTEFVRKHVVYSRFAKYPKIDRYISTNRLERIRREILVEMPDPRQTVSHREYVSVGYDKVLYKDVMKRRWNPYESCPIGSAAELCYTLRKVVNLEPQRLAKAAALAEKAKRAIIFYNYDYELNELRKIEGLTGLEVFEWNGHKHDDLPTGRNGSWVYLVQYTAGAEGWNCITTDTVIFYSLNYSYRTMAQCEGRINRMNTPYTDLYYYCLMSYSGIDLAIRRAIKTKKKFNERVFASKFGV